MMLHLFDNNYKIHQVTIDHDKAALGIVTGRNEKVGHLHQLVLSEGLLVLTPVILVSSLPALDSFLDGGWKEKMIRLR